MSQEGTIVQCIGAVVDVEFPRDQMPHIYDALKMDEIGLTLEVEQQLGDGIVRTIALGSSDGLRRGMKVVNTNAPISVPVGPKTLGRIMDAQSQRVSALNGFGAGTYKVLVATDVASRGIHVDNVAHVINYDLPDLAEDFIHRVGRTGRAGLKGRASTLVSGAEIGELRAIERTLKLKIARKRVDGSEIAAMKPRIVKNTLDSRTLAQLPGEVFC